jgi:transcriptional regulator with XRE-family HTH domain
MKKIATPHVSDFGGGFPYPPFMKHDKKWQGWGQRFRLACRVNGLTLAQVAEKMDLAESTLRSWTNGTREINLSTFFHLCAAADVSPYAILGIEVEDEILLAVLSAWAQADDQERRLLQIAAKSVLDKHGRSREPGTRSKPSIP